MLILTLTMLNKTWAVEMPSYSLDRYEALWKNSPFVLPAEIQSISLAQTLKLMSVMGMGKEMYVTIQDKGSQQKTTLKNGTKSNDMELVSVEFGSDPSRTIVKIKKGGEMALLHFDKNESSSIPVKGTVLTPEQPKSPRSMPTRSMPPKQTPSSEQERTIAPTVKKQMPTLPHKPVPLSGGSTNSMTP